MTDAPSPTPPEPPVVPQVPATPTQPSAVPTRKVAAGGVGGAIATILVWVLRLFGVEAPGEVAAAFATAFGFIVAYFTREPTST